MYYGWKRKKEKLTLQNSCKALSVMDPQEPSALNTNPQIPPPLFHLLTSHLSYPLFSHLVAVWQMLENVQLCILLCFLNSFTVNFLKAFSQKQSLQVTCFQISPMLRGDIATIYVTHPPLMHIFIASRLRWSTDTSENNIHKWPHCSERCIPCIYFGNKFNRITPAMADLHWLPISQCTGF